MTFATWRAVAAMRSGRYSISERIGVNQLQLVRQQLGRGHLHVGGHEFRGEPLQGGVGLQDRRGRAKDDEVRFADRHERGVGTPVRAHDVGRGGRLDPQGPRRGVGADHEGLGLPVDVDDADPPHAPALPADERQPGAFAAEDQGIGDAHGLADRRCGDAQRARAAVAVVERIRRRRRRSE